jgi:hypothetical protein
MPGGAHEWAAPPRANPVADLLQPRAAQIRRRAARARSVCGCRREDCEGAATSGSSDPAMADVSRSQRSGPPRGGRIGAFDGRRRRLAEARHCQAPHVGRQYKPPSIAIMPALLLRLPDYCYAHLRGARPSGDHRAVVMRPTGDVGGGDRFHRQGGKACVRKPLRLSEDAEVRPCSPESARQRQNRAKSGGETTFAGLDWRVEERNSVVTMWPPRAPNVARSSAESRN